MTHTPRYSDGRAQGINVDDYCGACVSYNNTFENITFNNIEGVCITVETNATGHIFKNNIFNNCGIASTFVGRNNVDIVMRDYNTYLQNISSSFIDNTALDGIINYKFQVNQGGILNMTVNETSTNYHLINLSNDGIIKFSYNGRKDFRVENNTITINNMVAPNNDIKNITSGNVIATNQNNFTVTISPNVELQVGDFTPPSFANNQNNASATTFNTGDIQINITVEDDSNISSVILAWDVTGVFVNISTQNYDGSGNVTAIFNQTITNLPLTGGTVSYKFQSNDTLNNINISQTFTFTVQDNTPTNNLRGTISSTILRSGLAVFLAIFVLLTLITPVMINMGKQPEQRWEVEQWMKFYIISIIVIFLIIILIEQIFNVTA